MHTFTTNTRVLAGNLYYLLVLLPLLIVPSVVHAQSEEPKQTLTVGAYVDAYYGYFSDSLPPNTFQSYTTVSPRHARIGLNVAQLSVKYADADIRSAVTLHAGDIAAATWSSDFTLVQEANVGVRLLDKLWLDAGFFTTHIGTESFLPKNNMLSTTAVATYNEPFYQSGARLSYEPAGRFSSQLWVLNGYNRFLDNNNAKSLGLFLSYAFIDNLQLTYTSLLGKESDEGTVHTQFRTYHNLYLTTNWRQKLFLVIGADLGSQTNSRLLAPHKTAYMYNWLVKSRYQFTPRVAATVRAERFKDPDGFISGVLEETDGTKRGLQLYGLTAGIEYNPAAGAYLRLEGRKLWAENNMFYTDGAYTGQRLEVHATFGIAIEKVFPLETTKN